MTTFVLNRDMKNKIETVVNVDGNTIELYDYILAEKYYSDQAGVTANEFVNILNTMKGDITVRVNSRGGDVGTALTMYQRLKEYKDTVNVVVDGYAYSCAAWILLAGDNRTINTGGIVMIHNPAMYCSIEKEEDFSTLKNQWEAHRSAIVNIIKENTNLKEDKIKDMMSKTTFMTAQESITNGFCDSIQSDTKVFKSTVKNAMPPEVKNNFKEEKPEENFLHPEYNRALKLRALAIKNYNI